MEPYAHRDGSLVVTHNFNKQMATTDEYTDHSHPFYEMFYFIEGDIEYILENRRYILKPYDLMLIRPNEHHRFRILSEKRYERMVIFFSDDNVPGAVAALLKDKGSLYSVGDTAIAEVLRRMDRNASEFSGDMLSVLMRGCFEELMIRYVCLDRDEVKSQHIHNGLDAVVEYINSNILLPLNIDDICRSFGMSRSYLFKAFTESFHESPKQYIIRHKIALAQQLIASGERPISASEKCGFADYSTFYRAYQRVTGSSPSGKKHTTRE